MPAGWTVVLDIGKSRSKATLWDENGVFVARRERTNPRITAVDSIVLDIEGIEQWLTGVLFEFAQTGPIAAIVPVAHGAGVALIQQNRLVTAPLDYEWPAPSVHREDYDRQRDSFAATGSPALPGGLNFGVQLHWLEARGLADLRNSEIVPWAQYWAWVLCGVTAAEVTSLGCHSDLWRPHDRTPSALAVNRGWAERLSRLTPANAVLGTLRQKWIKETGLSASVEVLCGMHDSNAALLAARNHPLVAGNDVTVLSTGTWFVAMRTPLGSSDADAVVLPQDRDCLLNVDVAGNAVPSSRFMGGREIEILSGIEISHANVAANRVSAAIQAIESLEMFIPPQVPGVGPFPTPQAATRASAPAGEPTALAHLYVAMLADVSLDLIGSTDTLLIDGRFAAAPAFTQALAALRPATKIFVGSDEDGVARGALGLANVPQAQAVTLRKVMPLQVDMTEYRSRWREAAERGH